MELFRLGNCLYAHRLDGEGARIYGGRWNTEGIPAVYFASSRALALLEVLVHLPTGLMPDDFCMANFEVETAYTEISAEKLPNGWNNIPFEQSTQVIGNRFLKQKEFLLLRVPSAIIKGEYNYIANPAHPDISKLKLLQKEPFSFDQRLI
ncbi:hypothetical protein BCY91_11490 [Pelobium manganitolerans]|uniref:RES domain-containing protein n=1 Tax=Pelobium manganitolerans TaxID=1842495 RepID=A0A419S2A8_9SPHI|nr:RES family NAD+ phosphorylase [Pelobium manganitolerans]RKD12858.1 hypothetical protein BCY91_11490 [Pelobium manganitolerans]